MNNGLSNHTMSVPSPGFLRGWAVVFVTAMLGLLGTGMFHYTRGIFLPSIAEQFDVGRLEVSLAFTAEAIVAAAFAPFLGRFLDIHSPRRIIMTGLSVLGLAYVALSQVQYLWQFYLTLMVGFGIGMSCMGTLAWNKITVEWFHQKRGLALSLGVLGGAVAGIVMPPLVTWLQHNHGWQFSYLVYSLPVFFVLLPLVYFVIADTPEQVGLYADGVTGNPEMENPALTGPEWRVTQIFSNRMFWLISTLFSVIVAATTVVILHLYGHLLTLGLSDYTAAVVISGMALASAGGKPFVGWAADRFGANTLITLSLLALAGSLCLLALAVDFLSAVSAAILIGLSYSGAVSLQSLVTSVAFGTRSFARVRGCMSPIMLPVIMTASPLTGLAYDSYGSYTNAFYVLSLLALCACALSLKLKMTPQIPN